MDDIAIFYATREGHSRSIARHIAGLLQQSGYEATLSDAADPARADELAGAAAAVLVSSVSGGKLEPEMHRLVADTRDRLAHVPAAVVAVAVVPDCDSVEQSAEIAHSMDRFFDTTGWHPDCDCSVAGVLALDEHELLLRWVMKCAGENHGSDERVLHSNWTGLERFVAELLARVGPGAPPASAP